ncbi:hypothetical protein BRD56_03920 [Thermoplasmatales archaeon SW_10_69_26]|nr:MAG: hypothetical protein BRD56_03920 [Thermoplasmatales archaeon SW_10_69_26]
MNEVANDLEPLRERLFDAARAHGEDPAAGPILQVFPEQRSFEVDLRLGLDIAEALDIELLLLRPAVVPDGTPLDDSDPQIVGPHREAVEAVVDRAEGRTQQIDGVVRLGHSLSSLVVQGAAEHDARLVLLPGQQPTSPGGAIPEDVAEEIMASLGSRSVVYSPPPVSERPSGVTAGLAGGPHREAVHWFAGVLGKAWDLRASMVHVIDSEAGGGEWDEELSRLREEVAVLQDADVDIRAEVFEEDDVAEALLRQGRDDGSLVVGAPTTGRLKRLVYGSTSRRVRRKAPGWSFVVHEGQLS